MSTVIKRNSNEITGFDSERERERERPTRDQTKSEPSLVDQLEWINLIYWSVTLRTENAFRSSLRGRERERERDGSFHETLPARRVPLQMIG